MTKHSAVKEQIDLHPCSFRYVWRTYRWKFGWHDIVVCVWQKSLVINYAV